MDREELIKNVKDLHEEIFEKLDDATTVFADKLNANCRLIFSYNDRRKVEESMGNTVDDIESSILTNDNRQYFEEAEVNSFDERLEYLTSTQLNKFIEEFELILDEIQYDIETLEGYDDVDSFLKDKRDGILDCYTIEF
jgi:hypothetical protein